MQTSGIFVHIPALRPSAGTCHPPEVKYFHSSLDSKSPLSTANSNSCAASLVRKLEFERRKSRTRSFHVRASGNSGGDLVPIAPLRLESPVGQVLSEMMKTHPHLLPAAIDQQLENLESAKNAKKDGILSSSQDILYKRIAEMKEKENEKTLEEILYCLVVARFVENGILMIPKIPETSDPAKRVNYWPNQEHKLESVHSPEAFEMIISHIALVLRDRAMEPVDSISEIAKIKVGKLYAASIMYGYFLKRVDERYQLERSMNTLPEGFDEEPEPVPEKQLWDPDSLIRIYPDEIDGGGLVVDSSDDDDKLNKLKAYVMYLDAETLQRYSTIRSKESVRILERQTQALFGRPDIRVAEDGTLGAMSDETIFLTFSGLTSLVLEAVAFGSFLWDAESYVESKCHFVNG